MIILGLFTKADAISRRSARLQEATTLAQDCAEWIAGSGDALEALAQAGFDEKWLRRQLARGGAKQIEEVFFAFLGSDGTLHIQRKHEYGENAVFVSTQGKKEGAE